MKKSVKVILLLVIFCVFCFAGYQVFDIFAMRKEASNSYDSLNQFVATPTNPKAQQTETTTANEKEEERPDRYMEVDFAGLLAENPEFFAWLYLPNDDIINYPVCQHEDNVYYLSHLFDGKQNANGTLFIDYRNDIEDFSDNSIIYGHTMKSATMFHALGKFKQQDYYEEHPCFYLELPEKEYRLEVFASYVTPAVSDAYTLNFNKEMSREIDSDGKEKIIYEYDESVPTFNKWYEDVMAKNLLKTDVKVEEGDKIFTFSACDYTFNNARFVVHCKAVDTNAKV